MKNVLAASGVALAALAVALALQLSFGGSGWGQSRWSADNNPLPDSNDRPQLLRFGMYVTPDPAQNPIDPPERFTGYHTALDLETTAEEQDMPVPVTAVCQGRVVHSEAVEGYGGVIIQACALDEQPVTVLYGHLDAASLAKVGTRLRPGDRLGLLAAANSADSGFTRKHLHLGIHKGTDIEVRGYVPSEAELANFLDPEEVLGI